MKIDWAEPAIADLDAIHEFIARDSAHYATRFVQRLIEAAERLATLPQMGRLVPEGDGRHREVLEPPYRIVYRIEDDVVHIIRIIHSARDLSVVRTELDSDR